MALICSEVGSTFFAVGVRHRKDLGLDISWPPAGLAGLTGARGSAEGPGCYSRPSPFMVGEHTTQYCIVIQTAVVAHWKLIMSKYETCEILYLKLPVPNPVHGAVL